MATIASISVSLVAKTKPFVKGLQKAARKAKGFAKNVAGLAAKIGGLALAGAGLGAAFSFGKSLKDLDKIGKLSKATGLTTEQLQVLQVVADRGGVELNQMSKSALKLSGFAFDALISKTEDARRIFRALGISNVELTAGMKDSGALLGLVVGKWNSMEDGVTKTAVAQKLFGSRMAQVVSAFPEGARTIANVTKELRELGMIVSPERIANVEAFNDTFDNLTRVFKSFSDALTGGAAGKGQEFLQGLFDKLALFIKEKGGLQAFADVVLTSIAEKFNMIVSAVQAFVDGMRQLVDFFKGLQRFAGILKFMANIGGFGKVATALPGIIGDVITTEDPQIAGVIAELIGLREDVKAGGGFV